MGNMLIFLYYMLSKRGRPRLFRPLIDNVLVVLDVGGCAVGSDQNLAGADALIIVEKVQTVMNQPH
jgi:hypothetical protein